MSTIAGFIMMLGAFIAVLAGIGVIRFSTSFARIHAAGKASPVAFLIAAIGAGLELGWDGAAHMSIAVVAMIITLPVGVHLLFRAVHRSTPTDHLVADGLRRSSAAD